MANKNSNWGILLDAEGLMAAMALNSIKCPVLVDPGGDKPYRLEMDEVEIFDVLLKSRVIDSLERSISEIPVLQIPIDIFSSEALKWYLPITFCNSEVKMVNHPSVFCV